MLIAECEMTAKRGCLTIELPCKGSVHDGDGLRSLGVIVGKCTSGKNRDAEGCKVIRRNVGEAGAYAIPRLFAILDHDWPVQSSLVRYAETDCCILNARDLAHGSDTLLQK